MKSALAPHVHLFVCANRREEGSPLGAGCSDRGEALYLALKHEVMERGLVARTWVTKTHCLGICPKRGATVARWPAPPPGPIFCDVEVGDVSALLALESTELVPPTAIVREIDALEELQSKKVLDLARRLKPGLTLEDIQNPHDFPELADPDWHYADGVLAGIQSVRAAVRALVRRA